MLRKLFTVLLVGSVSLILVLGSLEAVLRLRPDLISLRVLLDFDKPLRGELVRARGLSTQEDLRCLPPNGRHGKLCLFRPGQRYVMPVSEADRSYGAIAAIAHDERGFCNPPEKASWERVDVVVVGDSMTWCSGVQPDHAFAAILGERLGRRTYNLGVHGIGPYEYLEVLRRFGLALEPVSAVMVVSSNDLRDALRYWKDREHHDTQDEGERVLDAVAGGIGQSYAINFLRSSTKMLSRELLSSEIDFRYSVETAGGPLEMNLSNANGDEVQTARRLARGEVDLSVWDPALDDFAALGRDHGFEAILAYVPPAHAAYASSAEFRDEQVGRDANAAVERERAYLLQAARVRGLRFVDLTEGLRDAAPRELEPLYFPANVHLSPQGHAVVASILARALGVLSTTQAVAR